MQTVILTLTRLIFRYEKKSNRKHFRSYVHGKYLSIIFIYQVEDYVLGIKLLKIFKHKIFHYWHKNSGTLETFCLSKYN